MKKANFRFICSCPMKHQKIVSLGSMNKKHPKSLVCIFKSPFKFNYDFQRLPEFKTIWNQVLEDTQKNFGFPIPTVEKLIVEVFKNFLIQNGWEVPVQHIPSLIVFLTIDNPELPSDFMRKPVQCFYNQIRHTNEFWNYAELPAPYKSRNRRIKSKQVPEHIISLKADLRLLKRSAKSTESLSAPVLEILNKPQDQQLAHLENLLRQGKLDQVREIIATVSSYKVMLRPAPKEIRHKQQSKTYDFVKNSDSLQADSGGWVYGPGKGGIHRGRRYP